MQRHTRPPPARLSEAPGPRSRGPCPLLDFEDLLLLGRGEIFDFLRFRVSELLELFERTLLFDLADFLFLFELFDGLLDVATDVSHRRAVILQNSVDVLDELFA